MTDRETLAKMIELGEYALCYSNDFSFGGWTKTDDANNALIIAALRAPQAHNGTGDKEPCFLCGEKCNRFAANPDEWPIPLCHDDDPDLVKWHHIGCVYSRLGRSPQAEVTEEQHARILNQDSLKPKLMWRDKAAQDRFWKIYGDNVEAVLAIFKPEGSKCQSQ